MTQLLRRKALIRVILFACLAAWCACIGVTSAATFATWATASLLTTAFAAAAARVYLREARQAPTTLRFAGSALGMRSELLLAAISGGLLMVASYVLVQLPDAATRVIDIRRLVPRGCFALLAAALASWLLLAHRSLWEVSRGRGIVHYWSRAFGRGAPFVKIHLYWDRAYGGPSHRQEPVAWALHAAAAEDVGFEIVRVSLNTSERRRAELLHAWRSRLEFASDGTLCVAAGRPFDEYAAAA